MRGYVKRCQKRRLEDAHHKFQSLRDPACLLYRCNERLGTHPLPFFSFFGWVSVLKLIIRKKGSLIFKGLPGNLEEGNPPA